MSLVLLEPTSNILSAKRKRKQTEKAAALATASLSDVEASMVPAASLAAASSAPAPNNSGDDSQATPAQSKPAASKPKSKSVADTKKSQRQANEPKKKTCKYAKTIARGIGAARSAGNRAYYESIELYEEKSTDAKIRIARGSVVTVWEQKPSGKQYTVWALWIPLNGCYATMVLQPVGETDGDPILTAAQHVLTVSEAGEIPEAAKKWLDDATKPAAAKAQTVTLSKVPRKKRRASISSSTTHAATSQSLDAGVVDTIVSQVAANGRTHSMELGRQLTLKLDEMSELIANKVVEKMTHLYGDRIKFLEEELKDSTKLLGAAAVRH
jgi:hypothetical protein